VPEAAFALVWIPIALAPVSNVFFPSVALAERTLYLASVGACLALGALAQRLARDRQAAVIAGAALLMVLGTARVWTRTPVWRSDKSYVLTLLRDHPESYRAHLVAGRVLASQQQYEAAAGHLEEASRLFPRDPAGAFEAAQVAARLGRLERADSLYTEAMAASSADPPLLLARADLRYGRRDDAGAIRDAHAALSAAPDSVRGWIIVAMASRRAGKLAAADTALRRAIGLAPEDWELRAGLADLMLLRGDSVRARAEADSAVVLSHGAPPAVALLARVQGRAPARGDSLPAARIGS
jgi:tetratricopeptide (TPR) repeat protein